MLLPIWPSSQQSCSPGLSEPVTREAGTLGQSPLSRLCFLPTLETHPSPGSCQFLVPVASEMGQTSQPPACPSVFPLVLPSSPSPPPSPGPKMKIESSHRNVCVHPGCLAPKGVGGLAAPSSIFVCPSHPKSPFLTFFLIFLN